MVVLSRECWLLNYCQNQYVTDRLTRKALRALELEITEVSIFDPNLISGLELEDPVALAVSVCTIFGQKYYLFSIGGIVNKKLSDQ